MDQQTRNTWKEKTRLRTRSVVSLAMAALTFTVSVLPMQNTKQCVSFQKLFI